jgi:hypothetical protein
LGQSGEGGREEEENDEERVERRGGILKKFRERWARPRGLRPKFVPNSATGWGVKVNFSSSF